MGLTNDGSYTASTLHVTQKVTHGVIWKATKLGLQNKIKLNNWSQKRIRNKYSLDSKF